MYRYWFTAWSYRAQFLFRQKLPRDGGLMFSYPDNTCTSTWSKIWPFWLPVCAASHEVQSTQRSLFRWNAQIHHFRGARPARAQGGMPIMIGLPK
jgi:hypothetical protein